MRRRLCSSSLDGPVYVPFIGDGDIAADVYSDRAVYGADLDGDRVERARGRFDSSDIRVADCDGWPFPDVSERFAIADFDAYTNPYKSFTSFWSHAQKEDRIVVFLTDGIRQAIKRNGRITYPDGRKEHITGQNAKRLMNIRWFHKTVTPWFVELVRPYRIKRKAHYYRGMQLYWGAVLEKQDG